MRTPRARLADILTACEAIDHHLGATEADQGILVDALRVRLLEIGEATKALPDSLIADEPDVAWDEIARMRDHLAHHYFDTTYTVVFETARYAVPALADAARRLVRLLDEAEPPERAD